ncbi:MAG: diheme cytochrome c [Rhodocyclaceae bacterium]|nr:diheme cytochrome c [Rhodocyclaceae bacterium]
MNIPYRPLALGFLLLGLSAAVLQRAQAGGHYYAPVADPVVKEECGSCHLAFAPAMLPASSWQRMMGDLQNHFGDDASVDAATAAKISRYLTANAADAGNQRQGGKWLRGVDAGNAPLRITEMPKWVREHRKVSDREWRQKDVRTKANCVACHAGAEKGYYED